MGYQGDLKGYYGPVPGALTGRCPYPPGGGETLPRLPRTPSKKGKGQGVEIPENTFQPGDDTKEEQITDGPSLNMASTLQLLRKQGSRGRGSGRRGGTDV